MSVVTQQPPLPRRSPQWLTDLRACTRPRAPRARRPGPRVSSGDGDPSGTHTLQAGAHGGSPQAGPKPLGNPRCRGTLWEENPGACFPSEQSHDSSSSPSTCTSLPYSSPFSTWVLGLTIHLQPGGVRPGGPGPDCTSKGGGRCSQEPASNPPCSVAVCARAPMGHCAGLGRCVGVFVNKQGGEVASRALTQMQVVQAKREEQGRHCHLEPVGEVVATYGGATGGTRQGMAPLTSPLCFSGCSSRLVFGMLYPAYASYKAVKTKNIREYVSGAVGSGGVGCDSLGEGYGRTWGGGWGESELASPSSRGIHG